MMIYLLLSVQHHKLKVRRIDEEVEYANISYTTGGTSLSALTAQLTGDANIAGAQTTNRWALSATFAF